MLRKKERKKSWCLKPVSNCHSCSMITDSTNGW